MQEEILIKPNENYDNFNIWATLSKYSTIRFLKEVNMPLCEIYINNIGDYKISLLSKYFRVYSKEKTLIFPHQIDEYTLDDVNEPSNNNIFIYKIYVGENFYNEIGYIEYIDVEKNIDLEISGFSFSNGYFFDLFGDVDRQTAEKLIFR